MLYKSLKISFAQIEGISARAAMKETDANDNGIDDGIETETIPWITNKEN